MVVGCFTELVEKGVDPEDENSYYGDEEDQGEVDPSIAAKGLGQVGNVPIQDSLWSRCVPEDLQSQYRKWRSASGGVGSSDGVGVREMLDALVRDGAPSKRAGIMDASGKAQVRPKSSTKCVFILNRVKQNEWRNWAPSGLAIDLFCMHCTEEGSVNYTPVFWSTHGPLFVPACTAFELRCLDQYGPPVWPFPCCHSPSSPPRLDPGHRAYSLRR